MLDWARDIDGCRANPVATISAGGAQLKRMTPHPPRVEIYLRNLNEFRKF